RLARTSPSRMWRSVRQTPQAWTATSASPGPGSRSATSGARRSGLPGASRTMARTGPSSTLGSDMAAPTDTFDLGRLRLTPGEGRRLTLGLRLGDFDFGGERYAVEPALIDATLDISRMTGNGYALRLRFDAGLTGPCMRCLEPAAPVTSVDAREVHQPGGGEELTSPYVHDEELDVRGWAHDAYALA